MANLTEMTRRTLVKAALGTTLAPFVAGRAYAAGDPIRRAIPSSGEQLPVIGLGTSGVFDVTAGEDGLAPRREIVKIMRESGASVIDTSPMYGRAEDVTGQLMAELNARPAMFVATKVWTEGRDAGIEQMRRSFELLRTDVIDLMQVHNLVDLDTQLRSVRDLQAQGKVRYTGITHYRVQAFDRLAEVMRNEKLDFVQLNYSIVTRDSEQMLLPLASERGIGIIVNRAFEDGAIFQRVRGKPLPGWATEFGINSWAQYFLKYVVSHPAVTVAIVGTSKPRHMIDNLEAGQGALPDAAARQRMVQYLESL